MTRKPRHQAQMIWLATFALAAGVVASAAGAQQRTPQRPPLRPLGQAVATSEAIASIAAVRALSDGRVLVNDPVSRRVLLLDSAMKLIRVVADTTAATQKAYSTVDGGLLAYRGDSTLFVDPASYSMLVIDPSGEINRVIAAPRPEEVSALLGGARGGNAGFDAKGRLVYRNNANFSFRLSQPRPQSGRQAAPPQPADTTPIVRFNLATRTEDTAAFTHVATTRLVWVNTEGGQRIAPVINPLQLVDDWALLPDGTIAIVRKNYHVDFIANDGTKSSGPLIPFDWKRLTDSAKIALIDSVREARSGGRARTAAAGSSASDSARPRPEVAVSGGGGGARAGRGGGGGGGGGFRAGGFRVAGGAGGAGRGADGADAAPFNGGAARAALQSSVRFVEPKELPDYEPAFAAGAVHSDGDGKLWVRIITKDTTANGPAYDVIDRTGKLIDCVVTPKGTTVAGFGPDGAVYLGVRDKAGVHLVRAREK